MRTCRRGNRGSRKAAVTRRTRSPRGKSAAGGLDGNLSPLGSGEDVDSAQSGKDNKTSNEAAAGAQGLSGGTVGTAVDGLEQEDEASEASTAAIDSSTSIGAAAQRNSDPPEVQHAAAGSSADLHELVTATGVIFLSSLLGDSRGGQKAQGNSFIDTSSSLSSSTKDNDGKDPNDGVVDHDNNGLEGAAESSVHRRGVASPRTRGPFRPLPS